MSIFEIKCGAWPIPLFAERPIPLFAESKSINDKIIK